MRKCVHLIGLYHARALSVTVTEWTKECPLWVCHQADLLSALSKCTEMITDVCWNWGKVPWLEVNRPSDVIALQVTFNRIWSLGLQKPSMLHSAACRQLVSYGTRHMSATWSNVLLDRGSSTCIVGWFAARTWKCSIKMCTCLPKLLCTFYSIYKIY